MTFVALLLTALAAPPSVVSTEPADGADGLPAGATTLRVTFDQPMLTNSWSFTGGGLSFPETRGQPTFESPTTCALPITLEPDRVYQVGINSRSKTGFRTPAGEAAEPALLTFSTAPEAPDPDGAALSEASLDALAAALKTRYSYRDRLGLDWWGLLTADPTLTRAPGGAAFAREAAGLLTAAQDPHIRVEYRGASLTTTPADGDPGVSQDALKRAVPGWDQLSPEVAIGGFYDGVGYLQVTGFGDARGTREALHLAMAALIDAPGLVIDVRHSGGGNEDIAKELAAYFLTETVTYARHRSHDARGFTTEQPRELRARDDVRYDGPVAVLQSGATVSSAEAFLLMMRQANRARAFGARSLGSSGNPQPVELPNGVKVWLPSWEAMDAEGVVFEGVGLAPDVATPDGQDPLEAALTWVRAWQEG